MARRRQMTAQRNAGPRYLALIGDIVASRDLAAKQRAKLQTSLRAWIEGLNSRLDDSLAAPLTLTAGDEIQGLLREPRAVVEVVQELADRLCQLEGQPTALFGAGWGELSTGPLPPKGRSVSPALLDGSAFHLAREALKMAQGIGGWVRFEGFGVSPDGESHDDVPDLVLDALFGLMGAIRERWTVAQATLSHRMRRSSADPVGQRHVTQKEVARALRISPSVVSESLKASRHFTLLEGEEAARAFLASLAEARS